MPITIYPGTVKKRNLNGTYSDLVPGADANPQLANDIAEEYDPVAGVYSVGDYCIYQSVLYKCITAISIPEAFDNIKWTDVSVAEELTSQRNTLNQLDGKVDDTVILGTPVICASVSYSGTYTVTGLTASHECVGIKLTTNATPPVLLAVNSPPADIEISDPVDNNGTIEYTVEISANLYTSPGIIVTPIFIRAQ